MEVFIVVTVKMDVVMGVVRNQFGICVYVKTQLYLNLFILFHIYKETKAENQINDKLTTRENAIFEATLKHDPQRDTQHHHYRTPP